MRRHTPRLTPHARERARQMGVRTRVVKEVVRDADLRYVSWGGMIARSAKHPDLAVPYYDLPGGGWLALSVLPNTQERYTREGAA